MPRLEDLFLCQAGSINDVIDSGQLRRLLKLEKRHYFDIRLCEELVHHFGDRTKMVINFEGFRSIWRHLINRRSEFDFLAKGKSSLPESAFKWALETTAGQEITLQFSRQISGFYKDEILFDSFVHALNHIHNISRQVCFSICANMASIYRRSILHFKDHPVFYFNCLFETLSINNQLINIPSSVLSSAEVEEILQHGPVSIIYSKNQENDFVLNPEDMSYAESNISDTQSDISYISGFSLWYSRRFEESNDFVLNAENNHHSDSNNSYVSSWDEESLLQEYDRIMQSLV